MSSQHPKKFSGFAAFHIFDFQIRDIQFIFYYIWQVFIFTLCLFPHFSWVCFYAVALKILEMGDNLSGVSAHPVVTLSLLGFEKQSIATGVHMQAQSAPPNTFGVFVYFMLHCKPENFYVSLIFVIKKIR